MKESRKERKERIAKEVDLLFVGFLGTVGDATFENALLLKIATENPNLFIDRMKVQFDPERPHIGLRVGLKFVEFCNKYDNHPGRIVQKCQEIEKELMKEFNQSSV